VGSIITVRRVLSLVAPGALLFFVGWAVQQEEALRSLAEPYAIFVCFGTLGASALLSWHHNYARVLCATLIAALAILGMGGTPDPNVKIAIAFLLPLNFALFASMSERGLVTFHGAFKAAMIGIQVLAMKGIAESAPESLPGILRWGEDSVSWTWLPWTARTAFAVVAVFLLVLVCLRRTSVEAGLFWALATMFVALNRINIPGELYIYGSATGIILTFAVLEHSFDMAYRDELTGLPGRRAFKELLRQLRRRYTIAMCDVDNFKTVNDTYGHDAGDQILKTVASALVSIEGGGRAFRYGGEEFALVFNGRSADEVAPFVESMRDAIAQKGLVLKTREHSLVGGKRKKGPATVPPSVNITISIGVADNSGQNVRPEVVLEAADAALYRAKAAGKNCVKLVETASA
jgi:diguanylate cyclase (GGDEF)-like protein